MQSMGNFVKFERDMPTTRERKVNKCKYVSIKLFCRHFYLVSRIVYCSVMAMYYLVCGVN